MKKTEEDLTKLSIEELIKKLKTTKLVSGLLAGMLLVQLAMGIYLTIQDGFSIFVVLPVAFLPILLINFTSIKKIKEEIASRK